MGQIRKGTNHNRNLPSGLKHIYVRIGYDIGQKIYARINNGNIDAAYFHLAYKNHILEFTGGKVLMPYHHSFYAFVTAGNFNNIGYAYNFYENWGKMRNEITLGFRYGTANFSYDIQQIYIPSSLPEMPDYHWVGHRYIHRLHANWVEVEASIKAEIYRGLFLDLFIMGKRMIGSTKPENFDILYVPGFNRTNISKFGFGLGYGISYRFGL